MGSSHDRKLFSPCSGDWKAKVKVWAGLASPEASARLADHCFPSVLTKPPLCVQMSSYKGTRQTGRTSTPAAQFNLSYLCKGQCKWLPF